MSAPHLAALLGPLLILLSACTAPPTETEISGREIYERNCLQCHGTEARGDGPAASGMMPRPPSLRALREIYGGDFPRIYVAWMIRGQDGMAEPEMPMPDFSREGFDRTAPLEGHIAPAAPQLADLLDYLESIQD